MRKILSISLSDLIVILSFLFSHSSIYAADTVTVPIKQFGYGTLSGACISPDGSQFLTGSYDCNVRLWDANTGALIRTFSGHKDEIWSVVFSNDGSKFLSASADSSVKLWDVSTGELIRTFQQFKNIMYYACFTPDTTKIIIGGNHGCFVCNIATGKIIDTLSRENARYSPTFSSDGSRILINGITSLLENFATGDTIGYYKTFNSGLCSSIFPDGSMAVIPTQYAGRSILWNIKTGDLDTGAFIDTGATNNGKIIYYLTFSHDGSRLLCGYYDGVIRLWNTESKELIKTFVDTEGLDSHQPNFISFTADDSKFLVAIDNMVKIWDVEGNELHSFSMHANDIRSITYSHDGSKLLVGRDYHTVELLKAETGDLLHVFHVKECLHHVAAFSPNDSMILTNYNDTTIVLWEAETGDSIRTFSVNPTVICSAAFSPDGSKILTGLNTNKAMLWDAKSGDSIRTFSITKGTITAIAFSPDGSKIFTSESNNPAATIMWNVENGDSLKVFHHDDEFAYGLNVSPDGSKLITGSDVGHLTLWDILSGDSIRIFKSYTKDYNSIAFTPDGLKIISAGSNSPDAIQLWDVNTGNLIRVFKTHLSANNGPYVNAALSPDGMKVAGGYCDGVIRIWDISDPMSSHAHSVSAKKSSVSIMPISNNTLEIRLSRPVSTGTSLAIYTISGRKVAGFTLRKTDPECSFKVALPAGMGRGCYYFRYAGDGEIRTGKFLVVK